MNVYVNGKPRDLPLGGNVSDVLRLLHVDDARGVAVAVDGEVMPRSEWEGASLREGQRVEVLRAVQGG